MDYEFRMEVITSGIDFLMYDTGNSVLQAQVHL